MSLMPYQYVVLRCVPRVDREEFLNVGVVLHCEDADFLGCRSQVDHSRIQALFPDLDQASLAEVLDFVHGVCSGDPALGRVAGDSASLRFGFLRAPRSTVVQPGPVHGGLTADPETELDRLLAQLVL
ncbi:MAG TPA: DUF3037 domain-containing protein [Marmoricola sp.]|nr:DUF3037 domain-containing protein [Marmoricola sp.]HNI69804.1 DUF3037 domain-containing protein [Marmoricola sp.]